MVCLIASMVLIPLMKKALPAAAPPPDAHQTQRFHRVVVGTDLSGTL
jgi:hypothetical protein